MTGHKNTQFEGGHRVPFIVYWKGKTQEGKINTGLVSLTDIFATLAEVSGVSLIESEATDSENILPYWLDNSAQNTSRKNPLVTLGGQAFPRENPEGEGGKDWLSIRNGDLKLTVNEANFRTGEVQPVGLYDLGHSIKELSSTNLLDNKEYSPDLDSMLKDISSILINSRTDVKK